MQINKFKLFSGRYMRYSHMAEHSAPPSLNGKIFFSKQSLVEKFKKKSLRDRVTYKALPGQMRNKELHRCLLSLILL